MNTPAAPPSRPSTTAPTAGGVASDTTPRIDTDRTLVVADDGAVVGYRSGRPGVDDGLVIGEGAVIRSGSVVYVGSTIGDRFATGHNVVVREQCTIGDDVAIWSNSVIDYGCRIGDRVKIHSNCYVAQFTVMGDDAFMAPGVSVANDLYPGDERSAEAMAGPVIGPGAQIGAGVTLLPYVRIGAGTIVGAGAVVTADLPSGVVAYGNPARARGLVSELRPIDDRIPADHPLLGGRDD